MKGGPSPAWWTAVSTWGLLQPDLSACCQHRDQLQSDRTAPARGSVYSRQHKMQIRKCEPSEVALPIVRLDSNMAGWLNKYEKEKPTNSFFLKSFISASRMTAISFCKRATCCIKHFPNVHGHAIFALSWREAKSILYPGKQRFLMVWSSHFSSWLQNEALKLDSKKEVKCRGIKELESICLTNF